MSKAVNCAADYRFQVDIKVPNTSGVLAAPAAGAVTGIKVRLSATPFGSAINGAVDNLAASEAAGKAGRFYYEMDKTLLTTHVLPLGVGASFYAIWFKSGDMDNESVEFIVADGTVN